MRRGLKATPPLLFFRPFSLTRRIFPDEEGTERSLQRSRCARKSLTRRIFPDEEGTESAATLVWESGAEDARRIFPDEEGTESHDVPRQLANDDHPQNLPR